MAEEKIKEIHNFRIGEKVCWKSNSKRKRIVRSLSSGWHPPMAYVKTLVLGGEAFWVEEQYLRSATFNPSVR